MHVICLFFIISFSNKMVSSFEMSTFSSLLVVVARPA